MNTVRVFLTFKSQHHNNEKIKKMSLFYCDLERTVLEQEAKLLAPLHTGSTYWSWSTAFTKRTARIEFEHRVEEAGRHPEALPSAKLYGAWCLGKFDLWWR